MSTTRPHPMQPIHYVDGVVRFKANEIIKYLFAEGLLDLNRLARIPFPLEDREQLMQLLGYSLAGYEDLSFVSDESVIAAKTAAADAGFHL